MRNLDPASPYDYPFGPSAEEFNRGAEPIPPSRFPPGIPFHRPPDTEDQTGEVAGFAAVICATRNNREKRNTGEDVRGRAYFHGKQKVDVDRRVWKQHGHDSE